MLLSEVARALPGVLKQQGDAQITGVSIDSRSVRPGSVFIALRGKHADGNDYVLDALDRGAAAAVIGRSDVADALAKRGVPFLLVSDTVDACWRISKSIYHDASSRLVVVGVTGTNGKTTTAYIIAQMLSVLGKKAAYLGTLGAIFGEKKYDLPYTTPFAPHTFETLLQLEKDGAEAVVMEVSSHALDQRRVDGVQFDVGVFTNLSQDHLEYHQSMEHYFEAKRRLFLGVDSTKHLTAVVNADDEFGKRLLSEVSPTISFGVHEGDLQVERSDVSLDSLQMVFTYGNKRFVTSASLGAKFNVMNCAGAIASCIALGFAPDAAAEALKCAEAPPGRFETIPTHSDFTVIVDYAHTPDALKKLLASVRELRPARVLTVFGCGGDRDRSKRPLMGGAVASGSDVCFVTSDNPRTENPNAIIEEILTGIVPGTEVHVDPDREASIMAAVATARSGDVVVIAGKGHEDYQIIGTEKRHFDDREVARKAIMERAACV